MIGVKGTVENPAVLHWLSNDLSEAHSLGVSGWFPVLDANSMKTCFLQSGSFGDPDKIFIADVDSGRIQSMNELLITGKWSGPPLLWYGHNEILFKRDQSGNVFSRVSIDDGLVVDEISFFDHITFIASPKFSDDQFNLVSYDHGGCSELCWARRDGSRAGTIFSSQSPIVGALDGFSRQIACYEPFAGRLIWMDYSGNHTAELALQPDMVIGNLDWWKPLSLYGGVVYIGIGLNTIVVPHPSHHIEPAVVEGLVHASVPELSVDYVAPILEPEPELEGEIVETEAGQISCQSILSIRDVGEWSGKMPVLVCSGGPWEALGGGQRPGAIARSLVDFGYAVYYYSLGQLVSGTSDGVTIVSIYDWDEFSDELSKKPGVIFAGLPSYLPVVEKLVDAGWMLIYDMLDNWGAFVDHDGLPPINAEMEPDMIERAAVVTCSDPRLVERAGALGAANPCLLLNGGPPGLMPRRAAPSSMTTEGKWLATYIGHIHGSWFDWDIIRHFDDDKDVALTVIGGWTSYKFNRVRFVGEKPFPEIFHYSGAADVGIIPFCNPDITRYVDPVKAYDYWASGNWVVATPLLESMHDRPYTIIANEREFVNATKEAAELRWTDPIDADFVRENSWKNRAKQLSSVIEEISPVKKPYAIHPSPVSNVDIKNNGLRVTIQAPSVCNMYPPCPYCEPQGSWGDMAWSRSTSEWVDALLSFFENHVPVFSSACMGETVSNAESVSVWREIAYGHRIELVTNLLFQPRLIESLPRNGNVCFVTSFHPHKMNIDEFIERRQDVEEMGFETGKTLVVAYPPNLDRIPEWKSKLEAEGIEVEPIPYRGKYQGRLYPESYDDEQLALVNEWLEEEHGRSDLLLGCPRGLRCLAGYRYCYITWHGDVLSCSPSIFATRFGNIFDGKPIRLFDQPSICDSDLCECPDLWQFIQ